MFTVPPHHHAINPSPILFLKSRITVLTEILPKARLLESSERRGHVRLVVGVDEHGSSFQPLAYVHGFVDVARKDSRRQTKLCVVGSA